MTEGNEADLKTVPLVMYHEDRRIEIGTATVDTKTMEVKGHVVRGDEVSEIVGTVFRIGEVSL